MDASFSILNPSTKNLSNIANILQNARKKQAISPLNYTVIKTLVSKVNDIYIPAKTLTEKFTPASYGNLTDKMLQKFDTSNLELDNLLANYEQ